MKKFAPSAMGIGLTLFCSACAIDMRPSSIDVSDIVLVRPKSHIGQSERHGSQWRRIALSIAKKNILSLRKSESTYLVRINNCADKLLSIEEFYAGDVSTSQLSAMGEADFNGVNSRLRDPVVGYVYLNEAAYSKEAHICAIFEGGSMSGTWIRSQGFRIK